MIMNVSEQFHFYFVIMADGPAGFRGAVSAGIPGMGAALIEKKAIVGGAGIHTGMIQAGRCARPL
jgi:pyruvate/2-oxoglutarate dehydrogenase complex dihydrolipoamide dehydrogenase (E3) component